MTTPSVMAPLMTLVLCLWVSPMSQAYKFVDLSHVQNPNTLYWPGVPGWDRTIVGAGRNNFNVWMEVGAYSSGEHGGTHIDVPRHFVPNGLDLKDFPLERTVAEGVVIDCTAEAEADYDYGVTKEKLEQWEAEHGRIPNQAAVLFKFGYASKFWTPEQYLNSQTLDDATTYHFPHVSVEAVQWLVDSRDLMMIGMDVPSPDAPTDTTYPAHIILLNRNIMIMENVNIKDSLPPRDFRLHASPLKVENGTGVQTRIYAMLYERMNDGSPGLSSSKSQLIWSLLVCLSLVAAVMKILKQ